MDLEPDLKTKLRERARELQSQGLRLADIAVQLGITYNQLGNLLYGNRNGRQVRAGAPLKNEETALLVARIKELRKENYSYREISEKLGVTIGKVAYYAIRGEKERGAVTTSFTPRQPKGIVSVLGAPEAKDQKLIGFAAGYLSSWLEGYAVRHNLDAVALREDVAELLRKGGK